MFPPLGVQKSIVSNEPKGKRREEVFVDVVEKLNITFNSSGYVLTSEVDGSIVMRSFMSENVDVLLALNEDLAVGNRDQSPFGGDYGAGGALGVVLDDCNFHECVSLDNFERDRTLCVLRLTNYPAAFTVPGP